MGDECGSAVDRDDGYTVVAVSSRSDLRRSGRGRTAGRPGTRTGGESIDCVGGTDAIPRHILHHPQREAEDSQKKGGQHEHLSPLRYVGVPVHMECRRWRGCRCALAALRIAMMGTSTVRFTARHLSARHLGATEIVGLRFTPKKR